MAKIIINGRFLTRRITGVERFAHEIVSALDQLVAPGQVELACPPETKNLPQLTNISVVRVGKFHNQLWEHVSFALYVARSRAVSLNLCNVAPLMSPGIVCIHDMKVRATPQFFSKKFLLWYRILFGNAARRAKKILTVSEFSKSEIIKFYKLTSDKVVVVPNGWQHFEKISYDEQTLTKFQLEKERFFFSLCSLDPNKNFKWLAESARLNPSKTFIVAGGVNKTVFADDFGFRCPKNMKLIGYVSDEEAKTLMRDCEAFLFPSFYEGFGIPPLEAICAGTKCVVVSDIPVMHEILGKSAVYINPDEPCVLLSSSAASYENQLKSLYSWQKSALILKDLLDVFMN